MQQPFDLAAAILAYHPVLAGSVPLTQQLAMMPKQLHGVIVRMHVRGLCGGQPGAMRLTLSRAEPQALTPQLGAAHSAPELTALTVHVADKDPTSRARCSTAAVLPDHASSDDAGADVGVMTAQHAALQPLSSPDSLSKQNQASMSNVAEMWLAIAKLQHLTYLDMHLPEELLTQDMSSLSRLSSLQHVAFNLEGNFHGQLQAPSREQMACVIMTASTLTTITHLALKGVKTTVLFVISVGRTC